MIRFIAGVVSRIWIRLVSRYRRTSKRLRTVYLEELPETLDADTVYVMGEGEKKWFVAMICPCGCGAIVQVSLLPDAKPQWRLHEYGDNTISLHPSIWRKVGCHSHFFLRRGFIEWCGRE